MLRMAREGLGFELRNAVSAAKQQKVPFRKEGIQINSGDRTRNVRIEVAPLKLALVKEPCFVVVFDEASPASSSAMQIAGPIAASQGSKALEVEAARNQQLEQELANTKESLQSVIEKQEASNEEFQAANEEISSANEELQSTNEELETSKEELQSTNEELNTVNDELRARNAELNQLSNDLANLLATVSIPIIMVDCDLRIRRLTPMAEKVLRVIPADVGRLITDLKLNIDVPDLGKLIPAVIESLQPVEQEVQDERGKWHLLQLRPYRTSDNRIDGVVLALQDIDALKRSEQTFKQASTFMRSVVETVREPLLVLDRDLRVTMANKSFYTVFQVSPEETIERSLFDLGNGQWSIPHLRVLMGEVLPKAQAVHDFVVEHEFPHIGHKTMLLNARQISTADQPDRLILLAIEDITERKRAEEETLLSAERLASAGRIAATIAHEINNPLDALSNLMYLLGQQSAWDEASRNLVKRGEEELKRITSITRQTLGLFSSSSEIQEVALSQVLDETLELLGSKFREQNMSVKKRYDIKGHIQAAPTELRQVFTNLLVNALAATTAGGKLTLHVFASRDWRRPKRQGIRVVIADPGVGIPYEHQKKIFEPFFTTKGEKGNRPRAVRH